MTDDPVTNSMLTENIQHGTPKSGPNTLDELRTVPNSPDITPDIDVFNLEQYSDAALKQVVVDLRIKCARINAEVSEFNNIIKKFQRERAHLLSRLAFYQDITAVIQNYVEENDPCQPNNPDTPPATASMP